MRKFALLIALLLVFALIGAAACNDDDGVTTTTTVATTTTSPSTTTTTTTAPTTTTSTTSTTMPTTTTSVMECPISFKWGLGTASIGVLTEPAFDEEAGYMWVVVSGEFVDAYQQEVSLLGETIPVWFVNFSFGLCSVTGEEVVGSLFIGPDREEWGGIPVWRIVDGRSSMDPIMSGFEGQPTVIGVTELIGMLETNRLYPIKLPIAPIGLTPPPGTVEWCELEWACRVVFRELFSVDALNTIAYNSQLYEAILGESAPPLTGFGVTFRIDPLPAYYLEE